MSVVINQVRNGFYLDSVALMRMSVQLEAIDGVESASMMIATPSNRQILSDAGLLTDDSASAGGDDLIIALRIAREDDTQTALDTANQLLSDGPATQATALAQRPVNLDGALHELPGANLALISVPGDFAAGEAARALRRGVNVMVFSDNVSIESERELKQLAKERGLLMMGPDCGTAIINGVPLAFANQVPRGDIGIVAASGTGLQEVACLLARAGRGISQAIGTGGRDTSDAVGGLTTLAGIEWLAGDPDTAHIIVISKPPGDGTVQLILTALAQSGKPATVCFIGADPDTLKPMVSDADIQFCRTLTDTALAVCENFSIDMPQGLDDQTAARGRAIHGLFAGGTLCAEAQLILQDRSLPCYSNVPVTADAVDDAASHRLLDLGADEYTRGRPHPMLEPLVRQGVLLDSLQDRDVGVVLIDVVLGFGSHLSPADAVIDAVTQARGDNNTATIPTIIASVCGTDADPQSRMRQVAALTAAGIVVAESNAQAVHCAIDVVTS